MSKDDIIGILLIIIGWFIMLIPLDLKPFSVEFWFLMIGVWMVSIGHCIRK